MPSAVLDAMDYSTHSRIARQVVHDPLCHYVLYRTRCDCGAVFIEGERRMADHGSYTKHPEPDHSRIDLASALTKLREEAKAGDPRSATLLGHIDRLNADRDKIKRGALSKGGTHYWTSRNWKESTDGP